MQILGKSHLRLRHEAFIFQLDRHGLLLSTQLHDTRVKQSERDKLAVLENGHKIRSPSKVFI